jgi:hypothetical protein
LVNRGVSVEDPKLLREKAAQCRHFARSAQLPDVAEMLTRLAESFLERALRAEHGHGGLAPAYPLIRPDGEFNPGEI